MHSEWFEVGADAVAAIVATRAAGGRIVAAGTTTLRALESAAQRATAGGPLLPQRGETDIFITPGFTFQVVRPAADQFPPAPEHAADAGQRLLRPRHVMALYRHAVESRYRFFSYGDAMLLERAPRSLRSLPPEGASAADRRSRIRAGLGWVLRRQSAPCSTSTC